MNFEDLQKSWQGQPINVNTDRLKSSLQTKWQKYQRKVLTRIIISNILLAVTLIVLGWVYLSFHEQFGWPFKVSIAAAMYTIILIVIFLYWKGYAFRKQNMEASSSGYISYQLDKLSSQRRLITRYNWIYLALLWLALMMYLWEVTSIHPPVYRWTVLSATSAYILGVCLWYGLKKQKKQLIEIDEIITDLQHIKKQLID
ncbi:hypothetical protein [Pedobacter sp. NJ-S-72]